MLQRWLATVAIGIVAFVAAAMGLSHIASHPPVRPVSQPGPLIVVSVPTLSWTDVSPTRTPTLWALAKRGAVGAQQTRVAAAHSCSNQSWLALSAGAPALIGLPAGQTPISAPGTCRAPLEPQRLADGSAVFPDWVSWRHGAMRGGAAADPGLLGSSLAGAGQCITAAGAYTALGAANRDGGVTHYDPNPDTVDLKACPVTFVGLARPYDAGVARLLHRLPANATLVVTGMADDTKPGTSLHIAVMTGPGVPHGLLTSLSTRQPGFVQTTDLSALVLSRLGAAAPHLAEGRPPVVRPVASATSPITTVTGLTRALNVEHPFVARFFGLFLGGSALAVAIGVVGWWVTRARQRVRGEPRRFPVALRWWFAVIGAMCASMPMATFLVGLLPWWRSGHPQVALSLGIIGISAVLTAIALLGPWRRWVGGPMTFLLAATAFVFAQDVMHGSRLQLISLMGLQPVFGGRYFGQGNVGYAVFATSCLLLAAMVAGRVIDLGDRRFASAVVALIGLGAVIVDGYPSWGADGGGPVAMIPAFAYLALNAAGLSLTWKRFAVIAGATIAVVGSFAVLDYLRPPKYRTHLGDFVATLINTGQLTGLKTIWTQNWTMLNSSWLNMSVALLLLATVLVLLVPDVLGRPLQRVLARVTFLGHGLAAVAVCWMLGFFSNDSGTAIPPTGMLVVVPLLVLLAAMPNPADRSVPTTDDGSGDVIPLSSAHHEQPEPTDPDSEEAGVAGFTPGPQPA